MRQEQEFFISILCIEMRTRNKKLFLKVTRKCDANSHENSCYALLSSLPDLFTLIWCVIERLQVVCASNHLPPEYFLISADLKH